MTSVTQRIKQIKQPRGGYLNPKTFKITQFEDKQELNPIENIHSSLVGLVVDYLTRFLNGTQKKVAFNISLKGAAIVHDSNYAEKLLVSITGLDDTSITNACQLVGYDVCYRVGPMRYKTVKNIQPDKETIENIRILVKRSLNFLNQYGPTTSDGLSFEGGYSEIITIGDCDFLTNDTLWDFKVSVKGPTSSHTLQLLIYYLMGKRSVHPEFQTITSLGIFNPRLNTVYLLKLDEIAEEIITEVEEVVIGYPSTKQSAVINREFLTTPEINLSSQDINQNFSTTLKKDREKANNFEVPLTLTQESNSHRKKIIRVIIYIGLLFTIFILGFFIGNYMNYQEETENIPISSPEETVRDIRGEFETLIKESEQVLTGGLGFFRFYNLQIAFLREYEVQNVREAELVYELSDELLNSMYQEFKQNFTKENFEELKQQQFRWIEGKKAIEDTVTNKLTLFEELRDYTLDRCEEWVMAYYR